MSLGDALALVDREGRTTRIELGGFVNGLAWSPGGDAVLTAVADPALARARTLRRVALDGTVTQLYVAPGHITVHDVARDGRIILHHGFERSAVRGKPPGATEDREIPGFGQGWSLGFSEDGTRVLVRDAASQSNHLASLAGEAAVPLGPGLGWGLSGDARWALVLSPPGRMTVVPTGPGEALRFETPQWEGDQPSPRLPLRERGGPGAGGDAREHRRDTRPRPGRARPRPW
jgi:hypothetical protein